MLTLFTIAKFLHVIGAIAWVGGMLFLIVLQARMASVREIAVLRATWASSAFFAQRVFGPAAVLTLVSGVVATMQVGYPFHALWITWGFVGILLSLTLVFAMTRPTGRRLAVLLAEAEPSWDALRSLQRRQVGIGLLNLAILTSVVWAMVAKPML